MRNCFKKKLKVCLLSGIILISPFYNIFLGQSSYIEAYASYSATVKATTLNVRSGPSTSSAKIAVLGKGSAVTVLSEVKGGDGSRWCKISFAKGTGAVEGYVSAAYIQSGGKTYTYDAAFEQKLNAQGFPESYKVGLRQVHAMYPNWEFRAFKTGLDWNEVIKNESVVGRNLVAKTSKSSWKSTEPGTYDWNTSTWVGFDSSYWVGASTEIVKYYMDPRNFLDTTYIFQFLDQRYNPAIHTIDGVRSMVKNTYLDNNVEDGDLPYSASASSNSKLVFNKTYGSGLYHIATNINFNDVRYGSVPALTEDLRKILVSPSGEFTGNEILRSIMMSSTGGPVSGSPTVSQSASSSSVSNNNSSSGGSNLIGPSANIGHSSGNGPGNSGVAGNTSVPGTDQGAVNNIIQGTKSYSDIIMKAAGVSGINPYVLTAMLIQEQGVKGTSGLISGKVAPYNNIYNYFNIGAYQEGTKTATMRGLEWASINGSYGRPWNSREKAIVGGAVFYGENYVNAGQNTFYLKKFNVQGQNIYKHQYMTNTEGAADEGARFSSAYDENLKKQVTVFSIPIYNNMPDTPATMPTVDGSPNNKLASLSVDGYGLTPSFNMDVENYNVIVPADLSSVNVSAAVKDQTAKITGNGNINLGANGVKATVSVVAQNGSVRRYNINIIKQGSSVSQLTNASVSTAPVSGENNGDTNNGPGVGMNVNRGGESSVSVLGPKN